MGEDYRLEGIEYAYRSGKAEDGLQHRVEVSVVAVPDDEAEDGEDGRHREGERCQRKHVRDWSAIKSAIKNDLSGYLYKTTKRNPMILPVISEI